MKIYLSFLCCFLISSASYSQTCNRMADSLALVNIYTTHNGANWNSPWDLNTPMDTWRGVTLNTAGCVQRLLIGGQNFQGTLFDIDLPQLEILRFSYSPLLIGTIPDFSNLPNLKELAFSRAGFSGSIPDFSHIPNLERLTINGQDSLTGNLPDFTNLPQLQNLQLVSLRQVTGSIPDFSNLPNLRDLSIGISGFTGSIPDFSNLPNIVSLSFSQLDSLGGQIPNFTSIPSLIFLSISNTNISGQIPNFSNLPGLRTIFITNNDGLGGPFPDFVNFPNLEQIGFFDNNLTGPVPDLNLPKLIVLKIGNNQLNGTFPNLSNTPLLRSIIAGANPFTGNLPGFELLPKLEGLNLAITQMNGAIHDFSFNPLIEVIQLNGNQYSGLIPDLSHLIHLETLALDKNQLEGDVPDFSQNLNLESLGLSDNYFTSLPDLDSLNNLRHLYTNLNYFSFDDLIPNLGIPSSTYNYAPQRIFGTDTTESKFERESFRLHVPIDSLLTTNTYTWFKDNNIVAVTDSNTFVIPSLALADSGVYRCEITNSIITNLTLHTAETYLQVEEAPCGELTLISPDTLTQICHGVNGMDLIMSNNGINSVVDSNYAYVITDTNNVILEIPTSNSLDFSSYALGPYRVYGLSYADTLGFETNENIFQAIDRTDCDSISSNFLPVEVLPILSNPNFQVSYSMDSLTLTFEADSQFADITYQWQFEDDSITMGRIDTFTFPDYGTYEVCLIRTSFCGSDTTCQELSLNSPNTNGFVDLPSIDFKLLPNPTNSFLSISLPTDTHPIRKDWELSILNMQGETVYLSSRINTDEYTFSVADLAPGIYLCYLSSSKFNAWKKWIKTP